MPKKSITFNGWTGGVNLNSDSSDVRSVGDGKDEVSKCEEFLLDDPGVIKATTPYSLQYSSNNLVIQSNPNSSGTAGGEFNSDGTSGYESEHLLVKGQVLYDHQGVFSLGEKVNWSNNSLFQVNKPTDGTLNNTTSYGTAMDGIDVKLQDERSRDWICFAGRDAEFNKAENKGDSATFYNVKPIEGWSTDGHGNADTSPGYTVRYLTDTDSDGKLAENADHYDDDSNGSRNIETGSLPTSRPSWTAWQASDDTKNQNINTDDNFGADADDLQDVAFFGFHKYYNTGDEQTAGLSFRGGDQEISDSDHTVGVPKRGGFAVMSSGVNYGGGFNMVGHSIAVEIHIRWSDGMDFIAIMADSQDANPSIWFAEGNNDNYCKTWYITPEMWGSAGAEDGFARIVLTDEQATWTGPQYSPTVVNQIVVAPHFNSNSKANLGSDANTKTGYLMAVREVSTVAPSDSNWGDSEYNIHQTKLKNGIESLLATYSGTFKGGNGDAKFMIKQPLEPSLEGKVYYEELNKSGEPLSEPYLLGEWTYSDGWKSVLDNEFNEWDSSFEASTIFEGPPKFSTYALESGYPDGVIDINARWKYSSTNNRVVYIGNVQQPIDSNQSLDNWNNGKILKGVPGRAGGFADNQFIDLELKEDYITGMTSIGDRLLVFTKKKLFVVNVAQDIEFLEDEFNMLGVDSPAQFCVMEDGLAIVNGHGLYYFSPNLKDPATNLSEKIFPTIKFDFDSYGKSKSGVVYEPLKKILSVFVNDTPYVLYWSWKTKTFVGQTATNSLLRQPISNTVHATPYLTLNPSNVPSIMAIYKAANSFIYHVDYYGCTNDGTEGVITVAENNIIRPSREFITGTIYCGDINRKKKFYKLYFNAHNTAGSNKGLVSYSLDKGANWTTPSGQDNGNTVSEGENSITLNAIGKHITIKIESPSSEINSAQTYSDISLVYRERSIK